MGINHKIEIKDLSSHVLHGFMRCPYKFYWQHIKGKGTQHVDWREMIQQSVNKVINQFYQLPHENRSVFQILKLIDTYAKLEVKWFDSKGHYYTVLAKITDHLIQNLMKSEGPYPPLFLFEKYNVRSDELQTNLSLTIQVGEWGKDSFTIKKYLVDSNDEIINLYKYFTIGFSQQAFMRLPESIEIVTLLSGKSELLYPTIKDVQKSFDYLRLFKSLLEDRDNYIKTNTTEECRSCPFTQECNVTLDKTNYQ
jgi:hypothetical protein